MELRSRSRSNTPFLRESVEKDSKGTGNPTTRSTRRTVKTYESVVTESKSSRTKLLRSKGNKNLTSDYSSEEGETSVSSSSLDNARNQWKEDLHSVNGNGALSALKVYREAGEYWNKFPKTDYTYSLHSKDRVEVSPGVVAMPNMSRPSLHSNCRADICLNKQTSTESMTEDIVDNSYLINNQIRKQLHYSTGSENDSFEIHRRSIHDVTIIRRITRIFTSILTVIFLPFLYVYNKQHSLFIRLGKALYKATRMIMLWDNWLLHRKTAANRKLFGVVYLCLLPLLFFFGWWGIYGITYLFQNGLSSLPSSTLPPIIATETLEGNKIIKNQFDEQISNQHYLSDFDFNKKSEKILEKFTVSSSSSAPKAEDVAKGLTDEQLSIISGRVDMDVIVGKILENPYLQNVINNYNVIAELKNFDGENVDQENIKNMIIESLKQDISNIREDLLTLEKSSKDDVLNLNQEIIKKQNMVIESLNQEILSIRENLLVLEKSRQTEGITLLDQINRQSVQNNARLSFDVKQCCRKSFTQIENYIAKLLKDSKLSLVSGTASDISMRTFDEDYIKKIVADELAIYDADKTGLVDYAMESAGGYVISTKCTDSYQSKTAVVSILGIPIWYPSKTPRTVITPGAKPGECWAFHNFPGFLVIRLSGNVSISAFTMEHLSRKLVSNGKIDSAPRDFEVLGLENETDQDPKLLGKYAYSYNGPPLQYFPVQNKGSFDIVELRILSNHGNPSYTCLYRFRVHGELNSEPK